jgi:predicted nucleic acid-binding protein
MALAVVVDASVWVSRLAPGDVFHAASRQWFSQQAAEGGQWIAPALMPAEVVGAIARRTGQSELASRALTQLLQLPGLRIVSVDKRLGRAAARLAALARLRGADAVYAALAQHLAIPLVTWDEEIRQRMGGEISVIQPQP